MNRDLIAAALLGAAVAVLSGFIWTAGAAEPDPYHAMTMEEAFRLGWVMHACTEGEPGGNVTNLACRDYVEAFCVANQVANATECAL